MSLSSQRMGKVTILKSKTPMVQPRDSGYTIGVLSIPN